MQQMLLTSFTDTSQPARTPASLALQLTLLLFGDGWSLEGFDRLRWDPLQPPQSVIFRVCHVEADEDD